MTVPPDISNPPPGRSWRDIRQEVKPLAMSRQGRRRRLAGWAKAGALAAFVAGSGWGIYELAHSWSTDRAGLVTAVRSPVVRDIVVVPDGVLDRKWVAETLALPKTARLMALDLAALRDKLLANGQVRTAVLTRNFPDVLVVTLNERTPVARVQAVDSTGAAKQLLVAKDGVVYDGVNYDKAMLASLPWLDGIRLVKSAQGGFEPIAGMSEVSALLSTAQLNAPHLYREWLIVSLARLAERDEILVKAQDVPEIVFSRKRDFFKQIAQLDYVLDETKRVEPVLLVQTINLSLENQVAVTPQGGAMKALAVKNSPYLLQPSQRKPKREL